MISGKLRREVPLYLMLVPGLAIILIYCYVPMAGIGIAFQHFIPAKGFFSSEWAGMDNFEYIVKLPDTFRVLWNTVIIAVMKMILGLIVPLVVALLLNEVTRSGFKRSVQTMIYLPHFLSWVILGGILVDILSPSEGIVNGIVTAFGGKPVFFLADNSWFRFIIVVTDIWKEFGFGTIVFFAALTGINPTLYEAAAIDGASRWKMTWNVTIPGIVPIIILLATLSLGNVLNAGFDQIFNLYSPIVYETGDILDTMIYRIGLVDAQYSLATAIGLFKSVVSFVLISVSYWLAYRFANYRIF
ncbi:MULTISPECIES: ABC transporter permease [Cohnella]|uniref:Putative aldouronate transport system permease protein n=1 Tax=Cohnella phaseoli TaxID=456490 RepID=A0A3D9KTX2_9BACL|nr:ABC transporter permease subunit [Cohnella phaseoli]RED89105.1 putative aldouronate transport system permease protein [Cohnella phaseoli]